MFLVLFLAAAALPVGLTALVLIWLAGARLPALVAKGVSAVAFSVGPAYAMWRMEWFDVWRHGIPPLSYIVSAYTPYLACFAAVGWFAAGKVPRGSGD